MFVNYTLIPMKIANMELHPTLNKEFLTDEKYALLANTLLRNLMHFLKKK